MSTATGWRCDRFWSASAPFADKLKARDSRAQDKPAVFGIIGVDRSKPADLGDRRRPFSSAVGQAARGEPGRGGAAMELHIGPLEIVIAPLVAIMLLRLYFQHRSRK